MSEITVRLIYIHSAQSSLALIICLLFFYFSKKYKRPFLKWWAISWFCYVVQHIASILLMFDERSSLSLWGFLIIISSYLQLLYLYLGLYRFENRTSFARLHYIALGLVVFMSALSYLSFSDDPSATTYRYIFRVGLKSWIIGLGFIYIALRVLFISAFNNDKFSKYFLVTAFSVYGLQQLWYGTIVYLNATGTNTPFPITSFGIIDLFVIGVAGLGMIIWLLEHQHEKLMVTNKQLDSFLYSTSHDLRAPIASVLGLTNLGRIETQDELAKTYFTKIEERVKKLDHMFGDILSYSKSSKATLIKEKINIAELVNSVYEELKYSAQNEKVKFSFSSSSDSYVYSDKAQLTVILGNLLANSVKYIDTEKKENLIKVSFKKENKSKLKIIVWDNGIGIDEAGQKNIFKMFYRATSKSEGSGLGLFIANEAAKKLNGSINVESKVGSYSEFTLRFEESNS